MNLKTEIKRWRDKTLKRFSERFPARKESFKTSSHIQIPDLAIELDEWQYLQKLGFPGEFPFTRGIYPTMYRGRLWTMRQYSGYATAEETNQRFRFLLDQGQTGLSIAYDLPTQTGYDADHPLANGEVGKVGVSISSLKDMESLFNDIPLDQVSTSMTINSPAAILLAMYIAVAKRQGVEINKLRGTIQNDILKEYIARGTYIFPPEPSMRLITDVFRYCYQEVPRWNTISISGYHIREAGATAVQEIAFTLANGIAYVEAAIEAGLDIDEFSSRLSFFFNAHNNLLEEVAKYRAARRLWARIMRERFGATNPRSCMLRFHTQTAGSTLTAQQPENNVIRVTLQALAAVLGGTQSLHTNSMDEALWLPTEKAVQVALRTQQIIAHESGVADTIDPLAGSFFIEHLTDRIESEVEAYLQKIDDMGGARPAIEMGYMQNEILDAAYRYQQKMENREYLVVGVNAFETDEEITLDRLQVNPEIEQSQRSKLETLRKNRDDQRVTELLDRLDDQAKGRENLMPIFIECVENDITLGEICMVLRNNWGEYQPPSWL